MRTIDDDRGLAQLAAEVLDQVELARSRPVDVLEDDERRPLGAEALDHAPHREEHEPLVHDRGVRPEPEQQREVARRVRASAAGSERGDALVELVPCDLLRVRVEDSERLPHELGRRRGSRSAPRTAGSGRAGRALPRLISAAISRQSRDFPMPGGPTTVTSCGLALVHRLAPDRADQVQLARPPDERPEPRRPFRGLDDTGGRRATPRPASPSPSRRPAEAPRTRWRVASRAASPRRRRAGRPARPPAAGPPC